MITFVAMLHARRCVADLPLGQEQSNQSSTLHAVRDGYHYQSRWVCFRPHKPHEDDRDLFPLVLTPFFALVMLSRVDHVLRISFVLYHQWHSSTA